jgi:hypothetical protein
MKEVLETTLRVLDKKDGVACWVVGDVKDLNLAREIWNEVGSKIEIEDDKGVRYNYKLLGIIEDKIRDEEKVTKIWNSKSGKDTPLDRILIIAPSNSNPAIYKKNKDILWNKIEA